MADMSESLKPINTSFYDFEKLVTGGFVYTDLLGRNRPTAL